MENNLPQIKAAIYRANKELVIKKCPKKYECPYPHINHTIHLEHILRAIRGMVNLSLYAHLDELSMESDGKINGEYLHASYNLTKSLEDQEPQVLGFLYQLLIKE